MLFERNGGSPDWACTLRATSWLAPERRAQAVERFGRWMRQYGTGLYLFMFYVGLVTMRANLSDPVRLDERSLMIGLVVFLAYTGVWTVALIRSFRVPKECSRLEDAEAFCLRLASLCNMGRVSRQNQRRAGRMTPAGTILRIFRSSLAAADEPGACATSIRSRCAEFTIWRH